MLRKSPKSGQIAIGFLVVMGFLLFLVRMTVNLGQMSLVRTETSNAADAGALAAGSWLASGENEAAMVAPRTLDAVAMVQAIYLVPFCPDEGSQSRRRYANWLWQSLVEHPVDHGDGPVRFYRDVANAAMRSAWHVGGREFITASLNNMMLRFNTGPTGRTHCLGFMCATEIEWFGDLPGKLRDFQEWYYEDPPDVPTGLTFTWNNGLPLTDPKHLKHQSRLGIEGYPRQPPTLDMVRWPGVYFQYKTPERILSPPFNFFDCDFAGRGIQNYNANGHFAILTMARRFEDNPLAVDPATGKKHWELIDLDRMIPGLNQMDIGTCEHVCGITRRTTDLQEVLAVGIRNGNATITAEISHEVQAFAGNSPPDPVFGVSLPNWRSRFQNVASRARARVESATWFPTRRWANAYVERTD